MTIRAVDMPETRAEIAAWNREHGPSYFAACVAEGAQTVYTDHHTAQAAGTWFADHEAGLLSQAELFWVARDMTELCVAAARSMPAWSLAPEDLPAPSGMVFFEGLPDFRDFPTTAMAWGPCPPSVVQATGLKGAGLWISVYVSAEWIAVKEELDTGNLKMPLPPLLYDGETICAYGEREEGDLGFTTEDGFDVVHIENDTLISRASSIVVLKAAWLLMQQELAEGTILPADRATRKRLRRAGQDDNAPTRVIQLRRHRHQGAGGGGREYHHAWVVRGHWRQHWYPKRQVHRPVWIAPHIKGPEGAPLLGGEKVYVLKR